MKLSRSQLTLNAIFCVGLAGVIIWALLAEHDRPWKKYQQEFQKISKEERWLKGTKINQLWLQELNIVDRCTTCHQGTGKIKFSDAEQPFKTHSGNYLKNHPAETFGCVICHDGQGIALSVNAAHGDVKNWTKPLLKGHYAQSACGKCHLIDQNLPLHSELQGAVIFSEGWRLFRESGCIGCHKLSRYERSDRIAPALNYIGSKVTREWLRGWLKNPKDYSQKTRMPRFNLTNEEIGYIADYLLSDKHVIPAKAGIQSKKWVPVQSRNDKRKTSLDLINKGEKLVSALGCSGCHMTGEKGNDFAPPFSHIGDKVRLDWLRQFLRKPTAYDPKTIIPDFRIPGEDAPVIAAYLISLKKDVDTLQNVIPAKAKIQIKKLDSPDNDKVTHNTFEEQSAPSYDNIKQGKKLVTRLGCSGCHEIEDIRSFSDAPDLDGIGGKRVEDLFFGNIDNVEKTLISWLKIKVMQPGKFATEKVVTRMPDYDFKEEQADAIATFLLSVRKENVPEKYKKILIHPDEAETRGVTVIEKYNCLGCHKINKGGGDIGPDLTHEGKKTRQEWLYNFLMNPDKIRPLPVLKARMPDFRLTPKDAGIMVEYFSNIAGQSHPYGTEPKRLISPDDIWVGEKLYREVFACIACHSLNGKGGVIGPDHTDASSRLKREWIEQWLKNPQAIKPDTRMPRFPFKDWEFDALVSYVMTFGEYRFLEVKVVD